MSAIDTLGPLNLLTNGSVQRLATYHARTGNFPRRGLGDVPMGPVSTSIVPSIGDPPTPWMEAWEYASVNTRAPAGTVDPYANQPTPALYAPLPVQSGKFPIDFPFSIPQPHWSTQQLWWCGQTVLNVGAALYSNDPVEYLRSALIDSDFVRVKNFIMWYYAINNPDPTLYWDASTNSWGDHFLVTQPGADAINYLNLADYKYILTESGPVYFPLSYQDLTNLWNVFVPYMYQMSDSDMYQMQHLWALGAVPDPAKFPLADRLTPQGTPHSPYGPCMVPEMYRRGETALAAAAPYIEIIAAILAIVTAGLALAAFLAAGTGVGAAGAAGAVAATDVGTDVAVDTGADLAVTVTAPAALTTAGTVGADAIEEVVITGVAPASGALATSATIAAGAGLAAVGAANLTTQPQQTTQSQSQSSQKSTLQQALTVANQVKSVVGAGLTIASALKSTTGPMAATNDQNAQAGAEGLVTEAAPASGTLLYIALAAIAIVAVAS
jgi:hypothetical protein